MHAVAGRILHAAVEVDRQHAFRARGNATRTERVAEAVVPDFVAQAAAGGERIGVVADVGEKRMTFGVHLRREVAPLLVPHVAVLGQQRHGFHREGQHGPGALAVEPPHEPLLEPAQGLPVRARSVGEAELPEKALEIVTVVVGHIPEHGLEVPGSRRLVDRIDDLLETVGNHLIDGAALFERSAGSSARR